MEVLICLKSARQYSFGSCSKKEGKSEAESSITSVFNRKRIIIVSNKISEGSWGADFVYF